MTIDPATPRYCRDCKWLRDDRSSLRYARCAAPQIAGQHNTDSLIDPGFGGWYCSTARGWDHLCSPSAKYFEARPVEAQQPKRRWWARLVTS